MRPDMLRVAAIYNTKDDYPYVELAWGPMSGRLTSDEARAFAMQIITCALDAEQNAFLVDYLVEKVGIPSIKVGEILEEFKVWRERRLREN